MNDQNESTISAKLKAPRAGAVAGILFSILLGICVVLLRLSVPDSPKDPGMWLANSARSVNLALGLLPFAGITFLWFMGVLRDRMWEHEDRFLATVFLGSGFLFLAVVFASSSISAALIMSYQAIPGRLMESATYTLARSFAYELTNSYALRMAGVFMISTCTIDVRIHIFPRWIALLGFLLALFLIVTAGRWGWAPLVFPAWTFVVSAYILFANFRPQPTVKAAA